MGQDSLGQPGLEDPLMRARFSLTGLQQERLRKFSEKYPDGDLRLVSGELLYRRDQSEPYAKVDAGMFEKFEPLGDLADVAGDLPAILGGIASTARSRGLNLIPLLGRMFAGAAGGEAASQGVQAATGERKVAEPGRIVEAGVMEAAGGLAGAGLGKLINVGRGAGALDLPPESRAALGIAERRPELPQLMPQQVSPSPLVRRMAGQTGALIRTIGAKEREQQKAALDLLSSMQERGVAENVPTYLRATIESERNRLLRDVSQDFNWEEAGKELVGHVDGFLNGTYRQYVDALYRYARGLEQPKFNIQGVLDAAADIERGVPALARTEGKSSAADTFRAMDAERGLPVDQATPNTVDVSGGPGAALQRIITTIKQMDPNLGPVTLPDGRVVEPVDQLKALREQLWDLKTPNPGDIARAPEKQAGRLYRAISEVIDNPEGGSPEFRKAWDDATKAARDRFDLAEKAVIEGALRTETPTQFARRFVQPYQVDNLRVLRDSAPASFWREFQDGAKAELASDLPNLGRRLAEFDKPTLDLLLPQSAQTDLKTIAKEWGRIEQAGWQQALQRQSQGASLVRELVDRNDTASIGKLIEATGGPTTPFGKSIRAGMIDNILDEVTYTEKGATRINPDQLDRVLSKYQKTGALDLLTPSDRELLQDVKLYTDFLRSKSDSGTSLQAAEAVAGLRKLKASAISTLFETIGTGRVFTSPKAARLLYGTRNPSDFDELKVVAATLSQLAPDLAAESDDKRTAPATRSRAKAN